MLLFHLKYILYFLVIKVFEFTRKWWDWKHLQYLFTLAIDNNAFNNINNIYIQCLGQETKHVFTINIIVKKITILFSTNSD